MEPLHAPGLSIAPQAAQGTFAVQAAGRQADGHEVAFVPLHLPVVAPPGECHGGEDLGAEGEAFGVVRVVQVLFGDGGLSEALADCDALVGRLYIESEFGAI